MKALCLQLKKNKMDDKIKFKHVYLKLFFKKPSNTQYKELESKSIDLWYWFLNPIRCD